MDSQADGMSATAVPASATDEAQLHQAVLHRDLGDAEERGQLGDTPVLALGDGVLHRLGGHQQISREANVLAYNDVFMLISMLSIGAAMCLLLHLTFNAIKSRLRNTVPTETPLAA